MHAFKCAIYRSRELITRFGSSCWKKVGKKLALKQIFVWLGNLIVESVIIGIDFAFCLGFEFVIIYLDFDRKFCGMWSERHDFWWIYCKCQLSCSEMFQNALCRGEIELITSKLLATPLHKIFDKKYFQLIFTPFFLRCSYCHGAL